MVLYIILKAKINPDKADDDATVSSTVFHYYKNLKWGPTQNYVQVWVVSMALSSKLWSIHMSGLN